MKCDWCERPPVVRHAIRGFGSDGCFVWACDTHAGVASEAKSEYQWPDPPAVVAESLTLFNADAYRA